MGGARQTGGGRARIRAAWTAGLHFVPAVIFKNLQPVIDAQMPSTGAGSHSNRIGERTQKMAICIAAFHASKSTRCR